jgi:Tfp pilus assembly protein PilN
MNTVLYLANQQIQVVVGTAGQKKISVEKAYRADVPEGSMINGMIMDTEAFLDFIKAFWAKYQLPKKDIILVINSSKFIGKTIELPKLKDSKTLEFIEREFTSIKKDENEIYGYIPLAHKDKSVRRIYASSIPEEFIKDYLDIFKEADIQVKSIYSGESSLISLAEITTAQYYQTFILLFADQFTLTALLWVDGDFYHFNSTRCFNEQGTEEYAMDVARTVSQLIQFMQAHQIEHQLEVVSLAGIPKLDTMMYQMALDGYGINVPIKAFNSSLLSTSNDDVQSYLYATSGLVSNGKWQNFLNQYGKKKRGDGTQSALKKDLIIVGAVFGVMLVATLGTFALKVVKNNTLMTLKEENNSSQVVEQVQEYDKLLSRSSFLARQYSAIADINENIDSYPICDNGIIEVIEECAENYATVTFDSFTAQSGVITITAQSGTVDEINKFIKKLNKQTIFKQVDYTGYSQNTKTGIWDIHVSCTLNEAAGRGE